MFGADVAWAGSMYGTRDPNPPPPGFSCLSVGPLCGSDGLQGRIPVAAHRVCVVWRGRRSVVWWRLSHPLF